MAAASAEVLRHTLPGVNVPTCLVYGDNDPRAPLTPLTVAENLHAGINTSQLVVLEGPGHVCNVELPQQFNAVAQGFLVEQPPSS